MKTNNSTNGTHAVDRKALKQKYLECFGVRATNMNAWQEIVRDLIDQGVSRQTLVDWATTAGYSRGYVSSLLSRIFVSLGLRERREGAGRKPSKDALELLVYVRSRYRERFLKVLRAAWRAGKTQGQINLPRESPHRGRMNPIVEPQLGHGFNTAAPRLKTRAIRSGQKRRQALRAIFKRNFNTTTTARTKIRRK